jgi:hypothetical protein
VKSCNHDRSFSVSVRLVTALQNAQELHLARVFSAGCCFFPATALFIPFQENAMGILSNIFSKIFPSSHPTQNDAANTTAPASNTGVVAGQVTPLVDVESFLNDMAEKNPQKLNWQTSIVDLMKLLDLDSSLAARKELAKELLYQGDTNDSAAMNIWLHKQVMTKVAENGGKVPDELKH